MKKHTGHGEKKKSNIAGSGRQNMMKNKLVLARFYNFFRLGKGMEAWEK